MKRVIVEKEGAGAHLASEEAERSRLRRRHLKMPNGVKRDSMFNKDLSGLSNNANKCGDEAVCGDHLESSLYRVEGQWKWGERYA